ncbi:PEP-CTERM/exosortase system-associated acyltransferase [Billgrantia tianxiuensis]|jgi:N-acyl amino acid synthase of PEP-CTERM/exosortase system|uniref:PEP-CTERM/exosortase system-associated acyltransferase n=1 Tax=Billgrantia tianxiuensis TaxID=2497861 RepID=A0A6I6SU23_9GAMM|nr:PEP-CTERM/exosortase system-associated acyltransferase [Halomonas tianxiuensis]
MGRSRISELGRDNRSDLFSQLEEDFAFTLAHDERSRQRVYRLRYRIYCQEIGYNPPNEDDAALEQDAYDESALHCLLVHRKSGIAAGCFRLVLPAPGKDPKIRLPLQEYGGTSLTHKALHPSLLPIEEICEISRFATAREFRNRPINHETLDKPTYDFTLEERRVFPLLTIALFLATHALVGLVDRRHIFAMMASRLPRLLAMSGFRFQRIGDAIELHGRRNAFYIDNVMAQREMRRELLEPYRHIHRQLASQLPRAIANVAPLPLRILEEP